MREHTLDTTKIYRPEPSFPDGVEQQTSYVPEDQMSLGIKTKKFEPLASLNRRISRMEVNLEVMPFWKNFSFVFMFFSSLAVPGIIVITMLLNFKNIPLEVPLFYDPKISSWILVNKAVAVMIPIGFGVLNLILLNINYSIFQFDRRLAMIISLTSNLGNLLFLIAFSQILSIVLI